MSTPINMPADGPRQSSQLRNPGLDLTSDVGQKVYAGALERRLLFLSIRDVQLRSVCELATGRPYDSFDPSEMSYDDLMEYVANDMAKGLNISLGEARKRVQKNRETANPSQIEGTKDPSVHIEPPAKKSITGAKEKDSQHKSAS